MAEEVITAATICPATVAEAAPATPILQVKMSIGSKIILVTAPAICAIMGSFMLPPA